MLVEEFLRTDDDCGGTVRGRTTLKFCQEFVLCRRCQDLLERVDVVELRVGVIHTDIVSGVQVEVEGDL